MLHCDYMVTTTVTMQSLLSGPRCSDYWSLLSVPRCSDYSTVTTLYTPSTGYPLPWGSCRNLATRDLYSDCLRRESNFLASTRRITALCVRVCCIVCVCDCVMVIRKPTRKKCNIRTRTRQWPDTLKPKSYSLVEGNQTIVGNYTVTTWAATRFPITQSPFRNQGGTDTQFCSLPLVLLVDERTVTT